MIYADDANCYTRLVPLTVKHSKGEYVRRGIHTNSIESFWSTVKRAYIGVFHFWSDKHLHRYINEFSKKASLTKDFIDHVCDNANGKRLTYKELIK